MFVPGNNKKTGLLHFNNKKTGLLHFNNKKTGLLHFNNKKTGLLHFNNKKTGLLHFNNKKTGLLHFNNKKTGLLHFNNKKTGLLHFNNKKTGLLHFNNKKTGLLHFNNKKTGLLHFNNKKTGLLHFNNKKTGLLHFNNKKTGSAFMTHRVNPYASQGQPLRLTGSAYRVSPYDSQGQPTGSAHMTHRAAKWQQCQAQPSPPAASMTAPYSCRSSSRQKRSSAHHTHPPSSSSSKPPSPSSTSPSPSTTKPDSSEFLRNLQNKQHVHYLHDHDLDSIAEVSSSTVNQLTKLQQFILQENNDFREPQQPPNPSVLAVPSFSIKDEDPKNTRQQLWYDPTDTERNVNRLRTNQDPREKTNSISLQNNHSVSDYGEYSRDQDVWPYLGMEDDLSNVVEPFPGKQEEGRGGGRGRRSLRKWKYLQRGSEKTMEMLVVVDKSMMDRHGNKNITTYTLTLFNMVSKLFQDSSLGSKIHVVLVGLVLLEGDEPGLAINHHADQTLNSFCAWQSVLMGSRGRQHDHAVLLSATDFCSYKNSPCDTLGFAPIGGMCNQIRSCTINEDTGLNTALTIAHEIGHNFGMHHDGDGNYCHQTVGSIMAPTLVSKDGSLQWSVCSRAYLLRFLNTPQSACLDNKSQQVSELKFPDKLPGQLYDADVQCKWQFGASAQLCQYDFGKDTCKALWCYRGNKRCETKFLPAAEGTSCGPGKWCRGGRCAGYGRGGPGPVDGGWAPWGDWAQCTRTCGKGVQTRARECNRPLPQYGGRPCREEGKQHRLCNVHECPNANQDFHAAQCALYDKKPFRGWYMNWKPYNKLYDAREPCKLYCVAETMNYIFTIKHVAHDGTACNAQASAICIDGACQKVGCDLMFNSTAKIDSCGVCKGDNSSCRLISGEYSQQPQLNTYFPIVVLPKGARNVKIRERSISSNYLAIRNIYGHYHLNGNRRVAWPGIYRLAGASFTYKRPYNEPETLHTAGPLGEDVILEILVQDTNPGIHYQYTMPLARRPQKQALPDPHNYTWAHTASRCSQSCAGGEMTVSARCLKNQDTEVDSRHCDSDTKPKTGVSPCKPQPCPARWVEEPWAACSRTCGGGQQRRKTLCRQQVSKVKDRKLRKRQCKHLPKPHTRQRCNTQPCPPLWTARWVPAEWSACSKSCGGGKQVRRITCRKRISRSKERQVGKRHCKVLPKPAKRRHCHTHTCLPNWHTARWAKCSVQCGEGRQSRKVTCRAGTGTRLSPFVVHADHRCNVTARPPSTRPCRRHVCRSRLAWRVNPWGQCSVTCGTGHERREVWCSEGHSRHSHARCAHVPQPPSTQPCSRPRCPQLQSRPQHRQHYMARMAGPAAAPCVDREQWCHLVRQHKACGHQYYSHSCCHTCHEP
ncbi:hypothetical protein ACOMHN_001007 [Nucella lapillus]